jgi:hypothetical protein
MLNALLCAGMKCPRYRTPEGAESDCARPRRGAETHGDPGRGVGRSTKAHGSSGRGVGRSTEADRGPCGGVSRSAKADGDSYGGTDQSSGRIGSGAGANRKRTDLKNGKVILVEIKAALDDKSAVYAFARKAEFYAHKTSRQVDRRLIVASFADARVQQIGKELGIEVCTDVNALH